jgi:hypothetical protein
MACRSGPGDRESFAINRPPPPITPLTCAATNPATHRISRIRAPPAANNSVLDSGSRRTVTTNPPRSPSTCATTLAVLSAITEANPSLSGTPGRSR